MIYYWNAKKQVDTALSDGIQSANMFTEIESRNEILYSKFGKIVIVGSLTFLN